MLRLASVRKAYSSEARVEIPELTLSAGDRLLVAGANGSGKSTLLRLLAGVSTPTSGTIWRSAEWRGKRIGYVPQSGGLYDDLSVRANFELRGTLYRSATAFDGLIERLRLREWLPVRAGDLSGGFRRLVALVAALGPAPEILILDEPLDGIDAARRASVHEILSELAPTRALMVTAAPAPDYPVPHLNGVIQLEHGRATWVRRSESF
jgi:ABC-type multidrug transport system ATPase subunit